MAIDVEVRHIAVQALAHEVRHPAQTQDVAGAVKLQPILDGEPLLLFDLVGNQLQRRIIGLKAVAWPSHCAWSIL